MKHVVGVCIATMAIVLTGCASGPGSVAQDSNAKVLAAKQNFASHYQIQQIAEKKSAFKIGQSSVTVEKMAKLQNCLSVTGGNLISNSGNEEQYSVKCNDSRELYVNCEYRQCSFQEAAAPVVAINPTTTISNPVPSLSEPVKTNSNLIVQPVTQNQSYQQKIPARSDNPLKIVVALGAASGGDTLVTETYTNNTSTNTKAGSGAQLSTGLEYRLDENFSAQATFGYQQESTNASNGDVRFSRFPFEFLAYYHLTNSWRVGGGIRYDVSPKLSGAGAASNVGTLDFNNAQGYVLEAEYLFGKHFGIKLRGIKENFVQTGYSTKFSGNQIGVFFDLYY